MDTVYILGAGASACAGAPTTFQFRQAAIDTLQEVQEGPGLTAPGLRSAIHEWDEFPHLNIEEYYVLADLKERLDRTRGQQARNVRHLITQVLYSRLIHANTAVHDRFVQRIWANAGSDGRNLCVITTNWDVLLDNAVERLRSRVEKTVHLSYGPLDLAGGGPPPGANAAEASFRILKLHGSLSWWFCPEDGRVDCSRTEKQHLLHYQGGHGPECPQANHADHGNPKMEPFLIPPSAQKFSSDGPEEMMNALWEAARLALHHAKRIVFVGYSFPELDVQFRMLVIQALRQNAALQSIDIVTSKKLGQDRVAFEDRIRQILGGLEAYQLVKIDDRGFAAWCKDL